MAGLVYANAVLSTLFRTAAYIFLEVVPVRIGKTVLPTLYTLYLATYYFQPSSDTKHVPKKDTLNGDSKTADSKEQTPGEKALPPVPPPTITAADVFPTILFSLPSPSRSLRLANLAINTLLFVAAVEFVAYPYFDDASDVVYTRVGAVYPDAAKVVVRYPAMNSTDHIVHIVWRQVLGSDDADDKPWKDGPVMNLTQELDWVRTVKLDGLWPSTTYEYRLQDANQTFLSYPAFPIRFHTFPDPQLQSGSHFRFLASSCVTPNFPYVPLQGRRIKGFDLLADYVWPIEKQVASLASSGATEFADSSPTSSSTSSVSLSSETAHTSNESRVSSANASTTVATHPPTEFMIFMGDFIYADVPIYYGDDKEAYRRLYRRNYQSDSFRKVYERLPIYHTYDDHEIINNFAGQGNDTLPPFPSANDAFRLYNAEANYDSLEHEQHYYDFRYGDVAFFVMDTRRYRSVVAVTDEASRTMLGEKQLAALYDWLGKVNNTATFKFIVTSVPFTSLWQHDALVDSWAGFTYEKTALLSALHSVPNVVLLSGDRHEFAAIEYASEDPGHSVLEISTSPLSMFYVPFIRTLRMKSEGIVHKRREVVSLGENGTSEVTTVTEEIPQELVLKYVGKGNYKWSSIEVDTRNQEHPTVLVQIMIDGAEAYKLTVVGKPVKLRSSTTLGAYVPQSFKGVLDRIGLKPSRWF
ncbi:hypothetical protein AcW1_005469 [Taiwanofungus camphoratus]|nr:hypothetical protein AcW1_005469 [Antrodia cinnamomea]